MGLLYTPTFLLKHVKCYLDFANPRSYDGQGNTIIDLTQNNNNGTLVNVGYSSEFSGAGIFTFNSLLSLSALSIATVQQKTASVWFNATDTLPAQVIYKEGNQSSGLIIHVQNNALQCVFYPTSSIFITKKTIIEPNKWFNVAFNYYDAPPYIDVWVNGEKTTENTVFNNGNTTYYNGEDLNLSPNSLIPATVIMGTLSGISYLNNVVATGNGTNSFNLTGLLGNFISTADVTLSHDQIQRNFEAIKSRFKLRTGITDVVRPGLVCYLDPAKSSSFDLNNNFLNDISFNNNDGFFVNGINSDNVDAGYVTTDGVNQFVSISPNLNRFNVDNKFTRVIFFKYNQVNNSGDDVVNVLGSEATPGINMQLDTTSNNLSSLVLMNSKPLNFGKLHEFGFQSTINENLIFRKDTNVQALPFNYEDIYASGGGTSRTLCLYGDNTVTLFGSGYNWKYDAPTTIAGTWLKVMNFSDTCIYLSGFDGTYALGRSFDNGLTFDTSVPRKLNSNFTKITGKGAVRAVPPMVQNTVLCLSGKKLFVSGQQSRPIPDYTFLRQGLSAFWAFDSSLFESTFGSRTFVPEGNPTYLTTSVLISGAANCAGEGNRLILTSDIFNQTTRPTSFTISVWVRLGSSAGRIDQQNHICGSIFGTGTGWFSDNADFTLGTMFGIGLTGGSYQSIFVQDTNNRLVPFAWTHLVGTFDLPTRTIKFYKNNNFIGSSTYPSNQRIGQMGGNNHSNFNGFVLNGSPVPGGVGEYGFDYAFDMLGVWNRALSSNEVQQLYNFGLQRFALLPVEQDEQFDDISSGEFFGFALSGTDLYGAAQNNRFLGIGSNTNTLLHKLIKIPGQWKKIVSSNTNSFALSTNDVWFACGSNSVGQLGINTTSFTSTFTQIPADLLQIHPFRSTTIALSSNNKWVYAGLIPGTTFSVNDGDFSNFSPLNYSTLTQRRTTFTPLNLDFDAPPALLNLPTSNIPPANAYLNLYTLSGKAADMLITNDANIMNVIDLTGWNMVAESFDSFKNRRTYVFSNKNKTQILNESASSLLLYNNLDNIQIGQPGVSFDIGPVLMYNRSLNQKEILQTYEAFKNRFFDN